MFHILFLSWCIVSVSGFNFKHETFLDNEEKVKLLWNVEDDMAIFEVRANTTGYVGIGFSTNGGMNGADIMIGWVKDGTAYISDRHGIGNEEPEIDIQYDYDLLYGSETNGLTIIGYQRKLVTCDMDDYDITTDTMRVIWSYHPDDPEVMKATYHGPERRGVRSVIFIDLMPSNLKSLPDDVLTFDFLSDNTMVPSDSDTTYWCTHLELPALSDPHHVIRIEPIVQPGNEGIVHHLILKECHGLSNVNENKSLNCGSEAMYQFISCKKIIYAWAVGGGPLEFPEHVGYRIAGADYVTYLQLSIHYDNQQLIEDIRDSSGVRFHYTPQLRQYDASMLAIGVAPLKLWVIPPTEEAFAVYGSFDRKCSKEILTEGDMKIFSVFLHAHLAGIGIRLTHYRNGEYVGEIARDKTYDFNLQESRYIENNWIVKPGDDLLVECIYNTMDRQTATFGGLSTTDEMCLVFLSYYPKANAGACYNTPNQENLETLLNLGDIKNETLRQAIGNVEWTEDRRDAAIEWYRTPRLIKCTNHSDHSVFPEEDLHPVYSGFIETESLEYLIDLQSKIVEEDKCSHAVTLKAALLSVFAYLIAVTIFQI